MTETMHHARSKPATEGPKCRFCEHWQWEHAKKGKGDCWHGLVGEPMCTCPRYQPPKKEPKRKAIRKAAVGVQAWFAKLLGGRSLPSGTPTHSRQGDIDVEGHGWCMQVKHRRFPSWFREAFQQVRMGAIGTGRRELVGIIDKTGSGGGPALAVICEEAKQYKDFNGSDDENRCPCCGRDDGKEAP